MGSFQRKVGKQQRRTLSDHKSEKGQPIQWPKEKKNKTNNGLQNTSHKIKNRATRTQYFLCLCIWFNENKDIYPNVVELGCCSSIGFK